VPVDADVQQALQDMARESWSLMSQDDEGARLYEPSEKHGSIEYLFLPLTSELAAPLVGLHNANQLPIQAQVLNEPSDIFAYFCRLNDSENRSLTALRRATQFKGILKSRNRLGRMFDDTMRVIPDAVFKLDSDFDLLIDNNRSTCFVLVALNMQAICSGLSRMRRLGILRQSRPTFLLSTLTASIASQGDTRAPQDTWHR
jgi:hypothetical protein